MTMQISGEQEISGVPILRVRDWMARDSMRTRSCLVACFHRWKLTRYESSLNRAHLLHRVTYADECPLEIGLYRRKRRSGILMTHSFK